MATAKKRGDTWHIYVYVGKDKNGKSMQKHITAKTKKECEFLALNYKVGDKSTDLQNAQKTTLYRACEEYIDNKSNILSPSTIHGYHQILNSSYSSLQETDVNDITAQMLQTEINKDASTLSPKTVRNHYFFFLACINSIRPDFSPKVLLPQKQKKLITIPSSEEVEKLLELFKETPYYIQVCLAAYCGMRRGEICALEDKPKKNHLVVDKVVVINDIGGWEIKNHAKTEAGNRIVYIPDGLLKEFKKYKFTKCLPNTLSDYFYDTCEKHGIKIRFHDLRHYYASYLMSQNVPDKYVMERIGHSTDSMLKNIYQHTMNEKQNEIDGIVNKLWEEKSTPKIPPSTHETA